MKHGKRRPGDDIVRSWPVELLSETRAHLWQNLVPAIRDDSHGVRGGLEVGEARRRKDLHLDSTLANLAAMPIGRHTKEGWVTTAQRPGIARTHANEIAGSNASMMTDASVNATTSSTTSDGGLPSGRPRTTAVGIKLPSSAPRNERSVLTRCARDPRQTQTLTAQGSHRCCRIDACNACFDRLLQRVHFGNHGFR